MPCRRERALHILQTKFTYPQLPIGYAAILLSKRRIIPSLDIIRTEPDVPYSQNARLEFKSAGGMEPPPPGVDGPGELEKSTSRQRTRVLELRRSQWTRSA